MGIATLNPSYRAVAPSAIQSNGVVMPENVQIHYEFHRIKFAIAEEVSGKVAHAEGRLSIAGTKGHFDLALSPRADGEWTLIDTSCDDVVLDILRNPEILQQLLNKAAVLLKTINVWPVETECSTGARLAFNQQIAPSEFADRVFISFRPDMLSLPMEEWESIWPLIESRIYNDQHFRVHGFCLDEVVQAILPLRNIFSGAWVRARYRQKHIKPKLASALTQNTDGWFPAYQLARTALGAICIDPGWNYLVEIGLSVRELEKFNGIDRLIQQIARSPGTQHQLCLAAELFRRGHLLALEPKSGSGSATNDLLATCGNRQYEIEVKEFSSTDPAKQLQKEIKDKCRKLPEHPKRPVVFHAVLMEKGMFEKEKEALFFNAVRDLRQNIPPNISAIVAGKRFIDSTGGRVKRDAEVLVLNPTAQMPSNANDLATIFAKNYDSVHYPMFGIGSYFSFS